MGNEFKPKASVPIVFTYEDLEAIDFPHNDPLMIKLGIRDAMVSRVLVDGGSSTDIILRSGRRIGFTNKQSNSCL